MKPVRAVPVIKARRSRPRDAFVFLTIFAFFLQGLVTQTHIHGATLDGGGFSTLLGKVAAADEQGSAAKAPSKNAPTKDDAARCPFCQASQSTGSFLAPAALVLLLPWQNVSLVPLIVADTHAISTASHSWRGRAPPTA